MKVRDRLKQTAQSGGAQEEMSFESASEVKSGSTMSALMGASWSSTGSPRNERHARPSEALLTVLDATWDGCVVLGTVADTIGVQHCREVQSAICGVQLGLSRTACGRGIVHQPYYSLQLGRSCLALLLLGHRRPNRGLLVHGGAEALGIWIACLTLVMGLRCLGM